MGVHEGGKSKWSQEKERKWKHVCERTRQSREMAAKPAPHSAAFESKGQERLNHRARNERGDGGLQVPARPPARRGAIRSPQRGPPLAVGASVAEPRRGRERERGRERGRECGRPRQALSQGPAAAGTHKETMSVLINLRRLTSDQLPCEIVHVYGRRD